MSSPSRVGAWVLAARPKTLAAGMAPVVVGTALAQGDGTVRWLPAAACMVGCLLIQIGTNFANDYFDFKKGADTADRIGPDRAVQSGWITPRAMATATGVVLSLALGVGVYLIAIGGWPIAAIGIMSLVCAVAYTGGPVPLAYVGLGDVFVLLFFGLAAVVGTYWVQAGSAPPSVWVAATSVGLLATAILVVNNLRDRESDAAANKRTLAVRLGATAARWEYTALVLGAHGLVVMAVVLGWARGGWLLSLLALPLALVELRAIWTTDGAALNPHLGRAARLELVFALLLSVGAVL